PGVVSSACVPSPACTSRVSSSPPAIPPGGWTTMTWHAASPSGWKGFCTTSGPSWRREARTVRAPWRSNSRARLARHGACGMGASRGMPGSYCEKPPHPVLVHVPARAARDDLAALHHEVLVRERAREVVVLLDEQDRELAGFRERADRALDVLDDRRLDAFGGLVEDEKPWSHRERASDRELLLLAAGQVAAAP